MQQAASEPVSEIPPPASFASVVWEHRWTTRPTETVLERTGRCLSFALLFWNKNMYGHCERFNTADVELTEALTFICKVYLFNFFFFYSINYDALVFVWPVYRSSFSAAILWSFSVKLMWSEWNLLFQVSFYSLYRYNYSQQHFRPKLFPLHCQWICTCV